MEELRRALAGLGSDGLRRGGSGLWRDGSVATVVGEAEQK